MDLTGKTAGALLAGGISIAALHAVIPSHWLAFSLVGRAHRWHIRQTLTSVFLAGSGHMIMTTVLGCIVVVIGKDISKVVPAYLEHAATAALLVILGGYFMIFAQRHSHGNPELHVEALEGSPDTVLLETGHHHHHHKLNASKTTLAAMAVGMTLSPCLDLLPVYLAAASLPWVMVLGVSLAMAIVTIALMLGLVWVSCQGLARLNLRWLERNEGYAVGGILILLGIVLVKL